MANVEGAPLDEKTSRDLLFSLFQESSALDEELETICKDAIAAQQDNFLSRVNSLLSRGANPFSRGGQALFSAATAWHVDLLALLLNAPPPCPAPNAFHSYKNEALVLACQVYYDSKNDEKGENVGNVDACCRVVRLLLDHGASPNAKQGLALHLAVASNCFVLVELLLTRGALATEAGISLLPYRESNPCPWKLENDSKPANTLAALVGRSGNVHLLEILQKHGLDMQVAQNAASAMKEAVYAKKEDMIHALRHHPGAWDAFLCASVHLAACEGRVFGSFICPCDVPLSMLIDNMGARYDDENKKAIRGAALQGQLESVKFLLQHYEKIYKSTNDSEQQLVPTLTLGLVTAQTYRLVVKDVFSRASYTLPVFPDTQADRDAVCAWLVDEFFFSNNVDILQDLFRYSSSAWNAAVFRLVAPRIRGIFCDMDWQAQDTRYEFIQLFSAMYDNREKDLLHHNTLSTHLEFFDDLLLDFTNANLSELAVTVAGRNVRQVLISYLFSAVNGTKLDRFGQEEYDKRPADADLVLTWLKEHNLLETPSMCFNDLEHFLYDKKNGCPVQGARLALLLHSYETHGCLTLDDALHFANKFNLPDYADKCLAQGATLPANLLDLVRYGRRPNLIREYFASQGKQRMPLLSLAAAAAAKATNPLASDYHAVYKCLETCVKRGHDAALVEILLHAWFSPSQLCSILHLAFHHKQRKIALLLLLYGCKNVMHSPWVEEKFNADGLFLHDVDLTRLEWIAEWMDYDLLPSPIYILTQQTRLTTEADMSVLERWNKNTLRRLCDGDMILLSMTGKRLDICQDDAFIRYLTESAICKGEFCRAQKLVEQYNIPKMVWIEALAKNAVYHGNSTLLKTLKTTFPTQVNALEKTLLEMVLRHDHLSIIDILQPCLATRKGLVSRQKIDSPSLFSRLANPILSKSHPRSSANVLSCVTSQVLYDDKKIVSLLLEWFSKLCHPQHLSSFFNACIAVAPDFPVFCTSLLYTATLLPHERWSSLMPRDDAYPHWEALSRVFSSLDKKGALECMSVLLRDLLSYGIKFLPPCRVNVMALLIETCLCRHPPSTWMSDKLAEFFLRIVTTAETCKTLSDETLKTILKYSCRTKNTNVSDRNADGNVGSTNVGVSNASDILQADYLARFALQDWYAVYSVVQTLAVNAYCPDKDGTKRLDRNTDSIHNTTPPNQTATDASSSSPPPLPLVVLEHMTIRECALDHAFLIKHQP